MEFLLDFSLLAIVYFLFFHRRWKNKAKNTSVILHLMYLYICLVLSVTLMPFRLPLPGISGTNNLFLESINWIPFQDFLEHNRNALKEVCLNIVMMVPFGFLLPFIRRCYIVQTSGLGFLFSLGIEVMQLLYVWAGGMVTRSFDVTDLITNTLGAAIGYFTFKLFCATEKTNKKKNLGGFSDEKNK